MIKINCKTRYLKVLGVWYASDDDGKTWEIA